MEQFRNFIGGQFADAIDGRKLDVIEPATGAVYAQVARSGTEDVGRAVQAAQGAFPEWSGMGASARSERMLKLAQLIEDDLERFARAESVDTGKPIALARSVDIPRAVENFRFFATAILHTETAAHFMDATPTGGTAINYTMRSPRGVAGLISPWNLPLYLLSWKIAPAIATPSSGAISQRYERRPKPDEKAAADEPDLKPNMATPPTLSASSGQIGCADNPCSKPSQAKRTFQEQNRPVHWADEAAGDEMIREAYGRAALQDGL